MASRNEWRIRARVSVTYENMIVYRPTYQVVAVVAMGHEVSHTL